MIAKTIRLVPDNTVHIVTNHPPFGTQGILTLDITISPYIINPFFLFSILHYWFYSGEGLAGGVLVPSALSG